MLGSGTDLGERLYLQKGASGVISVPCKDLAQHQIDGIRFIFSQYKKEKLGAIVSFPPGCGNSVLVALFIYAIIEKLKKPVLIFYSTDQEKEAWLERFAKWTTIGEDSIEVETSNAYVRKQIFIKNIADVSKFYRRSWGIVVVKSDNFYNMFRKCQLKADFKIWITAQNLKNDKDLLRSVYAWINPSDNLMQEYLERKSPSLFREDTTNEMLLDMLLDEFMITGRAMKPFGVQKRKQELEIEPFPRVSKKNKDATGKKIKRSKKTQDPSYTSTCIENIPSVYDHDNTIITSSVFYKSSNANGTKSSANVETTNKDDEESKMDVETFIRDNDPLKSDIKINFALSSLDNTSQRTEASSPKAEEVSTETSLDFSSAVADIIRIENPIKEICEDSGNLDVEAPKDDSNLTEKVVLKDTVKETTGSSQIDVPEAAIQNVFFASQPDKGPIGAKSEGAGERKTDESEEATNGAAAPDQTSKLEVSTSVMKETDNSFDSKMKELGERALRKFKGSILDNILNT